MTKKISGTYEWATETVNCSIGCPNDCRYCYAKRISSLRKDILKYSEWPHKNEVRRNLQKEKTKHQGTVMFPSMHDIHPGNIDVCADVIANLLEAGNKVLITSKPRMECIERLVSDFTEYRHKILFRFTIGCLNNYLLKVWEPGAPSYEERVACLAYASSRGFLTSVSMEPMLNTRSVVEDAEALLKFTTETLWIGKMNKVRDRVTAIPEGEIRRIESEQRDEEIWKIFRQLRANPRIRWKESIKEVVGLELPQEAGLDK